MSFRGAERSSKNVKAVHYIGVRKKFHGGFGAEIRDRAITSRVWLGTFKTAVEAALAYDEAARALRGPRAITNFPPPHSHSDHSITRVLERLKAKAKGQDRTVTTRALKARKAKTDLPSAYHEKSIATKPWTHAYLTRHCNVGNARSDLASCDSRQLNHGTLDVNSQENLATTLLPPTASRGGKAKTNLPSAYREKSMAAKPWTHAFLTRHRNVGNAGSDLASSDSQQLNHDSLDINGASSSSTVIHKLHPSTSSEHDQRWLDLNLPPPAEDEEEHSSNPLWLLGFV